MEKQRYVYLLLFLLNLCHLIEIYDQMKKFFLIIAAILIAASAYCQTGTWSGSIDVQGIKLPLVFHFDTENPTVDSPDQGARGIKMQVEMDAIGKITVSIPSIAAIYEGFMLGNRIVGSFKQMGVSLPLTLSPGEIKLNRPQTPQGPFPYATEEVTFTNGDVTLKGTLVLPEGCTRETPVLLFVSGSGAQNRDEELFEHKPFAVIADAFARAGIATLRYDDRGVGESTGNFASSTTADFKNDAAAGVNYLRSRFDKVGVVGHSEGGTIALMLSAGKLVDFAISLAGMAVSGAETLLWQNKLSLAEAGFEQDVIDTYCQALGEAFEVITHGGAMPKADELDLPDVLKQNFLAVLIQLQTPYMKQFVSIDVRPSLGAITCPVLALNGTKDNQVEYQSNLDAIRSGLPGNGRNAVEAIDGVNHLFQHCKTGKVPEYREIEETFAPEVLQKMIEWITALP